MISRPIHAILKAMSSLHDVPPVPLTLEGSSLLHQMLRIRWADWRALPAARRDEILTEAAAALAQLEGQGSAMFSLLGHKGDLMLVHFRENFERIGEVERCLQEADPLPGLPGADVVVSIGGGAGVV